MFMRFSKSRCDLLEFIGHFLKLLLLTTILLLIASEIIEAKSAIGSGSDSNYYYRRVSINSTNFHGTIIGVELNLEENYAAIGKIEEEEEEKRKPLIAFRGIPYAKAPIRERRFQDPQPLDQFNGTLEALDDGYECPSITARNQSEDCLFLNVYTKNLPVDTSTKLLPVLVVIHPGGLYLFSSASYMVGPGQFLRKDVVLVTFNYRLGSLGFLNLGTKTVPGNAGFKDQVFALRWVQDYIRYFGGDPRDVTLMGYSAGALSVCLHLISPMSSPLSQFQAVGAKQQLFHKAIIMSGSVPPQVQLPKSEQRYLARRQLERLNCTTLPNREEEREFSEKNNHFNENDYFDCLNLYDGIQISQTLRKMFIFGKDNPVYLWLPIIEENLGQSEYFLKDNDFYTIFRKIKNGNGKIPLLIGYTDGEFCNSAVEILRQPQLSDALRRDYLQLFPKIFMYDKGEFNQSMIKARQTNISDENTDEMRSNGENHIIDDKDQNRERREGIDSITKQVIDHYFMGKLQLNAMDHDNLCDLFSDAFVRSGAHLLADLASKRGFPVYFYEFAAKVPYSHEETTKRQLMKEFPNKKDRVEHIEDFELLFNDENNKSSPPSREKLAKLYTDFMMDFIQNGKLSDAAAVSYPKGYAVIEAEQINYKNDGINFPNYSFWKQLFT